jgi:AcrR family transcriptional regulator/mRNA-degrading endonuclease toxin of MazEF toxin-antitoxin module
MTTSAQSSDSPRGETRARLLEGAIRTVQESGRSGATARAIASASEANLGSIVYYFGSKEELVDEALATAGKRWTEFVKANGFASASGTMVGERLASSLSAFMGSLSDNRPLAVAFLEALASADRSPSVLSALRDNYGALREAVAEGNGDGAGALGLGAEAPEAVAGAVVALFDGLLIQWFLDPDREVDPHDIVTGLGSAFGTGLVEAGYRSVQGGLFARSRGPAPGRSGGQVGAHPARGGDKRDRTARRQKGSQRGGIYRLKPPRRSREQTGTRYVVLLQAEELLRLDTALVAPTSRRVGSASFRPEIELRGAPTRVLVERLRTVDRERLEKRVGRLSADEERSVDAAVAAVLAIG